MIEHLVARATKTTRPITPVERGGLAKFLSKKPAALKRWVKESGFEGKRGQLCLVPDSAGKLSQVLLGLGEIDDPWGWAALPAKLPPGRYRVDIELTSAAAEAAALGWALGTYRFARYKTKKSDFAQLVWPAGADQLRVTALVEATALGRDLINTPAEDMGPEQLADAARDLAKRHGAKFKQIVGDKLLAENYPLVHAVGRASSRPPRLAEFVWGDASAPRLTLVGKGVCFDSGGLDLKNAAGMKLMKKDMGGAATVLALASVVMATALPVRLRVLVPCVENSVSGNAFRPLDVFRSRKGLTVEIGNTDAEGRLILCDALAEADSEQPDLLIDVATLTGAARVALGTQLPALFCNDDELALAALEASRQARDPLWRMPLFAPYREQLDSAVADLNNVSSGGYGGAITAALFLQEFVSKGTRWLHLDSMAWNLESRAGRPSGGEPMGLRALAVLLEQRYRGSAA